METQTKPSRINKANIITDIWAVTSGYVCRLCQMMNGD